jgi:hypothetical protein
VGKKYYHRTGACAIGTVIRGEIFASIDKQDEKKIIS